MKISGYLLVLFLLVLEAIIACSPLLAGHWFHSHDTPAHIGRLFAVSYEMQQGDFYPRWLSQASFGRGLPVLNYYSPAFYLVVGWTHVISGMRLEIVLKLICFLIFLLGAWGMFVWLKKYLDVFGSLVAATLYMFTPYHFLDIYVRGALPEFAALAILPFLFHAIDISFSDEKGRLGTVLMAVATAAIILTHNLTALMITPFAIFYFGAVAITQRARIRKILQAGTGAILGVGMSAFYWLPVLLEIRYLGQLSEATAKAFHYSKHFVYPRQWISRFWGFGVSWRGSGDGMSFQIGAVLLVCVLICFLALLYHHNSKKFHLNFLFLGMIGLFLTSSASSLIYELISPMQFIQFPWRFLGPSTMFLAAFAGFATTPEFFDRSAWRKPVFLGVILLLCIALSENQRAVKEMMPVDLDHEKEQSIKGKMIGDLGAKNEFLPRWALPEPASRETFEPAFLPSSPGSRFSDVSVRGSRMEFQVSGSHAATVLIPSFYFPGWQAGIDGVPATVAAAPGGFITCKVPAGEHRVAVWFGSTWPRMAGWAIAIVALALVGGLVAFRYPPNSSWNPAKGQSA